jgi:hypothetical protein
MRTRGFAASVLILGCSIMPLHAYVQTSGEGARATSMGNNYVALSSDWTAMFWNPAGYAFVPAREFQVSVEGVSQHTTSRFSGTDPNATFSDTNGDITLTRPRFANIGYMHAFPAVRGGFTIAAGFHSPYLFDDAFALKATSRGNTVYSADTKSKSYGSLDLWSVGFGLQVAEGLGIGAAVSLVTGQENADLLSALYTNGVIANPGQDYFEETVTGTYLGYDVRLGVMYSFLKRFRLGLRLVLPQTVWFTENGSDDFKYSPDSNYSFQNDKGRLLSSYSGALGGAAEFRFLTVSAEVRARAPYSFVNPSYNIPDNSLASKALFGAGLGLEAPLGVSWILGRAGFSWDQFDPYVFAKQYDDENSPEWDPAGGTPVGDKYRGSLGMGFILKNVLLEWSYGYTLWKLDSPGVSGTLHETHVQQNLLMSLSIRF